MFHVKQDRECVEASVRRALAATAAHLGLPAPCLGHGQVDLLVRLSEELASGAARIGLTKYSSPGAVVERLICPALAALAFLDAEAPLRVADIGSGSGALGLTLAVLCPRWHVTMVDRREKACRFAEVLGLRLGLDGVSVLKADAREDRPPAERFDAACFRAVASPLVDLALASGWVKPGGVAVVWTSLAKAGEVSTVAGWAFLGKRAGAGPNPWAAVAFVRQDSGDS